MSGQITNENISSTNTPNVGVNHRSKLFDLLKRPKPLQNQDFSFTQFTQSGKGDISPVQSIQQVTPEPFPATTVFNNPSSLPVVGAEIANNNLPIEIKNQLSSPQEVVNNIQTQTKEVKVPEVYKKVSASELTKANAEAVDKVNKSLEQAFSKFRNQKGAASEIEGKLNLKLPINQDKAA
jgi:hypothetical protein